MNKLIFSDAQYRYDASCKWRLNDTFEGGRLYQLIGENGSGKSTLGKIITGIEPVSTGTATVNGKMLQHMSQNEKRETFFYIPQEPHWLFIGDTFCQNLRYFSKSIKECADTNNIGHNEQHRQKLLSTIERSVWELTSEDVFLLAILEAKLWPRTVLFIDECPDLDDDDAIALFKDIINERLNLGLITFLARHIPMSLLEMETVLLEVGRFKH